MNKVINACAIFVMFAFISQSCGANKTSSMPRNKVAETSKGFAVYTGQVVEKEFYTKGGKATGTKDLYLRCSVQDYFIKFCESNISKKDVELLNLGEFDAIKVEAEIVDGEWDSCDSDNRVQSRTGSYIVIHKIL